MTASLDDTHAGGNRLLGAKQKAQRNQRVGLVAVFVNEWYAGFPTVYTRLRASSLMPSPHAGTAHSDSRCGASGHLRCGCVGKHLIPGGPSETLCGDYRQLGVSKGTEQTSLWLVTVDVNDSSNPTIKVTTTKAR